MEKHSDTFAFALGASLAYGVTKWAWVTMTNLSLAATGCQPMEVPDVTVSIGVASFPEHASTTEALVKAADDAMYVSKRSEKDKVVVSGMAPSPVPARATG